MVKQFLLYASQLRKKRLVSLTETIDETKNGVDLNNAKWQP